MNQPGATNGNGRDIERLPPQAVEVEQAVLGAMCIDARAVARAIEILDASCFYHIAHGKIYTAILSLYERNEPVDQLTLAEQLKKANELEEVGGVVYLATLAADVATAANIDHHCKIVLSKALNRKLIERAAAISARAFDGTVDADELLGWAEQEIFSLSEGQMGDGFEPLEKVLDQTFEELELAQNRDSSVSGVDTGFSDLNEETSGFQKGDLVILAARPSVGKTALALAFARHAAVETGVGVAVFSLEMNKQQIAQRLLSAETRVDLHRLRTGRLSDEDWLHLTRHVGKLAQAPIYIDDTAGISILEARAKARRLMRERGIGLVIVDYLQLMTSHVHINNREQEISMISRGLKGLAKELNVPVVALSQLSRAVESRTDKRPMLSDLRESGCLTGDTLVPMADTGERVPIRDLAQAARANAVVWALNPATKKIEKAEVSNAFCTGTKPVYCLTTQLGRSIRATANHKFLTLDGWKRLDELKNKEHIALPRVVPTVSRHSMDDTELALAGHLIGDGCVLPRHAVQYTSGNVDLASGVMGLAEVRTGQIELMEESEICWDPVASITMEGEEEVFDLTVPGHHNFIADDIIVHNSIEQDADVVFFIYRPEIYGIKSPEGEDLEGYAEIIIGKQRNGPTGTVPLMWNAESASYENMAPEWRSESEEPPYLSR